VHGADAGVEMEEREDAGFEGRAVYAWEPHIRGELPYYMVCVCVCVCVCMCVYG
jgi:hypothetical protein